MTFHQHTKNITVWLAAAGLLTLPLSAGAEEAAVKGSSSVSIGTAPGQAKVAGADSSDGAPPLTIRTSTQDWEFGYHGYLRAPMRLSFDKQKKITYPLVNGVPNTAGPGKQTDEWRFNAAPALVDSTYTDWKSTNIMGGPWAEMVFSYGNSIAVGSVSIASYNITDSGWRNLQSQLGIDQAWVTLNFPRAFGEMGGLTWNVGVFANRYGGAGRYDAGRYDTYIFGRTHIAGETLTAKLDLTPNMVLVLEHGFGAKSDTMTGDAKSVIDRSGSWGTTYGWIPYAGSEGQFPALVNHAHGGVVFHTHKLFKELLINAHFLHAFTRSADTGNGNIATWPFTQKNGKQIIAGGEIKANGAIFGDAYLGFSTMETDGLASMPDAIELLHSQGGWCMLKNFYGDMFLKDDVNSGVTSRSDKPNPGTGRINTLAWQYMFSVSRVLYYLQGKEFWGQGPDLTISTWGMFNAIKHDKELKPYLKRAVEKKLKFGAEMMYMPLQYFGFGLRFDRVIPDMDFDKNDTDLNNATTPSFAPFSVISPKILIRTAFLTHEEVNISYSRYFWDGPRDLVRAENPHEAENSDRNGLMLSVNMWW